MNRLKVSILLAATLAFCGTAYSQTLRDYVQENTGRCAGTHHKYEYCKDPDTPAPEGYAPFYFSNFGRHGSRFDTSKTRAEDSIKALEEFGKQGILTPVGEEVLAALRICKSCSDGLSGELTKLGIQEQDSIGIRTFNRFKPAFTNPERFRLNCISTTSPRCVRSMMAFVSGLRKNNKDLKASMAMSDSLQQYLTSSRPKENAMQKEIDSVYNANWHFEEFSSKIVTNIEAAGGQKKMDNLSGNILQSLNFYETMERPELNPAQFFSFDELVRLATIWNWGTYAELSNSPLGGKQLLKNYGGVLQNIINEADAAVAGNDVAANLRFSHDSHVTPLSALMGIDGLCESWWPSELDSHWFVGVNMCMASNIQLIFYRKSGSDKVLVKLLFNEKERTIHGLKAVNGVYYDWSELRNYWLDRIKG